LEEPVTDHDLVIRDGTIVDGTGTPRFVGDVAVDEGLITEVGTVDGTGAEEIDASGCIVTPGWVDVHTHYDGQATWDPELAPSSWHGVTTVVTGSCGVGFAPAARDRHQWLIGLMEGVEDIPGTALAEGITWNWESFPEYLDELESMPRTIDVGAMVPHGALRAYVLGEREAPGAVPTREDIDTMAALVADGVRAGALGFSTSRTHGARTKTGELIPGTTAEPEEVVRIVESMLSVGHGVLQLASDFALEQDEFEWLGRLSRETGLTVQMATVFTPAPTSGRPSMAFDEVMEAIARENASGAHLFGQVAPRGIGVIMGWQSSLHPFRFRPSFRDIAHLPWSEQLARIEDPTFRDRLLSEENRYPRSDVQGVFERFAVEWNHYYEIGDDFDYEPTREQSIEHLASKAGVEPQVYAYDLMTSNHGEGRCYLPIFNWRDGNLDFLEPLMTRNDTVIALSDAGAHCATICDASMPTYLLEHWARDRKRGAALSVETAVKLQTADTAHLFGLQDRGLLMPGYRADINVIDFERLRALPVYMAFDLPTGGKRLLQKAAGYVRTIKNGVVTFRDGEWTGATPGGLVRGPQRAMSSARA
jgi:N-acyl-D-amino-acid deacylase